MMTTEERDHQAIIIKGTDCDNGKTMTGNSSLHGTQTEFENKVVNYEVSLEKYKLQQQA